MPRASASAATPNEPGEVIGRIVNDPARPGNRFEGYAAANQNENKILHDVFEKGDAWFRTGDLMRKDERGYFYFVDRVGDTFRWKGENVSTSEVAEAINTFPGIADANVYGVTVVGRDGRAGMAAIVCDGQCDLARCTRISRANLPDYARPLFLRIQPKIDVTGTFKQKKVDLVREGFNPAATSDPIYFNDPQAKAFVRLDAGALPADRERRDPAVIASPQAVLAFWREAGPEKWFKKDTAFDDDIRARFLETYEAAAAGKLSGWEQTAEGALALVDRARSIPAQHVPRRRAHLRRRSAGPRRRRAGAGARLRPAGAVAERQFFYLPFEHSESLADQERCCALFAATGDADLLKWAQLHADIIRRFGRFPHRNAVLGRATTPEEQAFLDGGGFKG